MKNHHSDIMDQIAEQDTKELVVNIQNEQRDQIDKCGNKKIIAFNQEYNQKITELDNKTKNSISALNEIQTNMNTTMVNCP